jgi:hypothetical protein
MKVEPKKKGKMNVPASELPIEEKSEDFRSSFHWRVFRIMSEFVGGWQFLADFNKTVTFFGSARFPEGDKWYEKARKLGQLLSDHGLSVITGGGPGIMEAGNRGAKEGEHGDSVGLNIQLPYEQRINAYVEKGIGFHYFFVRKVMLSYAARAYVFFPGGFGTLDEFFEIITLIQTKKIQAIPVVLVGKEYWGPLTSWIKEQMHEKFKAIDEADQEIYKIVDTAEEAFEIVKDAPARSEFSEFICPSGPESG